MRETTPLSRTGGTLRPSDAPAPPPPPDVDDLPRHKPAPPPPPIPQTRSTSRLNGSQVLRPVQADDEDVDEPGESITSVLPRLSGLVNFDRSYVVPARWAIGALGAFIAVIVVVWAIAHRAGETAGRKGLIPSPPTDSAANGQSTGAEPTRLGGEPISAPPTAIPNTARTSPRPASSGSTQAPTSGLLAEDPRQPGNNYLLIQQGLKQSDADATAGFLTAKGVSSVAFPAGPVDRTSPDAKNRAQWMVIVAEAIPSSEYKNSARKTELLQKVKKLGMEWKKNPKGGFDFDSSLWTLCKAKPEGDKPPR